MKIKWLKLLRGFLFVVVALGTLLGLAIAFENYRGKRAWEACRAELAARGEPLDWSDLAPPPVPDDQNFFKTPLLAPLSDLVPEPVHRAYHEPRDSNAVAQVGALFSSLYPASRVQLSSWRLAQFTDLAAMQAELRGETNTRNADLRALQATPIGTPQSDLLWLLGKKSGELEEIRAALRRPHARYGIPAVDGAMALVPHLAPLRSFARAFATRALAELANGQAEAAAADITTCFQLARTFESEPLLIATLVEIAMLETAIQPLWEGLARHQWTEPQLAQFETELAKFNFVTGMARTLRFERAYSLGMLDSWRRKPRQAPMDMGDAEAPVGLPPSRMPSGWIRLGQVYIARMFQDFLVPVLDTNRVVVDIRLGERLAKEAEEHLQGWSPYKVLARLLFPALSPAVNRAAIAQTTVNHARLAVALERFRLVEGQFPAALRELAPRFLTTIPHDAVNGEPYPYRREAPDRFLLYSVGLNLTDDGAQVAQDKKGRAKPNAVEGDWVWRSGPAE